jgi:hypothetical protein
MATTAITSPRAAHAAPVSEAIIRPLSAVYWTSMALTAVSSAAVAFTFFTPGVLNGTAVMNGSARGTALVALLMAIPLLVASMILVARGGVRPVIAWLGAAAFLQYNAVLFLFATPWNSLFLLYVAMFALSFWTLVLLLRAIDVHAFAQRLSPRLPARALAAYLIVIAVLNAAAWLRGVIPGLFDRSPAFLDGTGLPTSPIYVQDLSFWIPLMAVTGLLLWRREAWGLVLAGGMFVYFFIESISVAVDQWMGGTADPTSTVASAANTPMFAVLAVIGLVPLFLYFRNLGQDEGSRKVV